MARDPAASELAFLAREMRRAGSRDILAELRDGLTRAAAPAADDARRSILAMPATHEAGLRRGIAGTVKVTTSLGATAVRVRVSATGPERWPGAAVTIEGRRWSHPVYGHRDRWVRQRGKPGWFEGAVAFHQPAFDRAVDEVTDRIERRLAGEA